MEFFGFNSSENFEDRTFLWRKTMLLFDDDLLDNKTDVIKSDGKRSIIYYVYGC